MQAGASLPSGAGDVESRTYGWVRKTINKLRSSRSFKAWRRDRGEKGEIPNNVKYDITNHERGEVRRMLIRSPPPPFEPTPAGSLSEGTDKATKSDDHLLLLPALARA